MAPALEIVASEKNGAAIFELHTQREATEWLDCSSSTILNFVVYQTPEILVKSMLTVGCRRPGNGQEDDH